MNNFQSKAALIWSIADLLRGSWKQHEYQDVILPLTVLKRLDSILADTKAEVLNNYNEFRGKVDTGPILKDITKTNFYTTSPYDFNKLLEDQSKISANLRNYIQGFSENVQQIIAKFDFDKQLERLEGGNLLYLIIKQFNKVDLHPSATSNHDMGYIFEELIRKFAEQSNDTAGEHYTPREVIKTMVQILYLPDKEDLKKEHKIKTIYDPCCGTGGMLTVSKEFIKNELKSDADIFLYGQELNPVTYAICKSEMLIKGEDADKIRGGEKDHSKASTLTNDQFHDLKFDYIIANPPYGVDWKKDADDVKREAGRGFAGRFGAGLPRISDGQLLFLQHMISKMRNKIDGGSRVAVVFNGSPLFTGDAGSGESEIRRWVLENDLLETIIALPDQLFFNTGISTYIWILSNRKTSARKGKVQLIDARTFFKKMRKSLGNKRHEICDEQREHIEELYKTFHNSKYSKIFNTTDFAFRQITIERPLKLNFQVNDDRIKQIKEQPAFTKLAESKKKGEQGLLEIEEGELMQNKIIEVLKTFDGKLYKNRDEFTDHFNQKFIDANLMLPAPLKKALFTGLSERDEEADICTDSKGKPETDTEKRDTENVPYGQDIYEYFEKEVKPYAPDAWIDESKKDDKDGKIGRVGYEIPVTRYFYEYEPPRPLEEIETDIEKVENELLNLIKELTQ